MNRRFVPLLFAMISLLAVACGSDATEVDTGSGTDSGGVTTTIPVDTTDSTIVTTTVATAPDGLAGELAAARERWLASGITDYTLVWSPSCFCPLATFTDTVVGGELVSHDAEGEVLWDSEGTTMERLFNEIERALADDPHQMDASFDPLTGAVESYWVDVDEMMADEEYGVTVSSVEPIVTTTPGAPILTAETFTVDHPCGHGFAAGAADQTVGLTLFFTGEWTEDGPSITKPIDLSNTDEWVARISVGTDLFSNWCDDVIEESDPIPHIDAEFTITHGTLAGEIDGPTATATLSNIVAIPEEGSGETIEIAELQLKNEAWGFFAG